MPADKLTKELKDALKTIVDHFDVEDQATRERQLRIAKKLKYYWAGFARIWWSETAHDWRVFDLANSANNQTTGDSVFYDKPVNVFKAYLESIIAALSSTVPSINCAPDDADNPDDLLTAKGANKIAELVYKHNDAPLLWIHALYIFCTEGMIASYRYTDESDEYGTYEKPKYEGEELEIENKVCPLCGQPLKPIDFVMSAEERNEFSPGNDDVIAHDQINDNQVVCSNCLEQVDPEIRKDKFIIDRMVGVTNEPKSRQCVETYGLLNVKVANYARKQCETPYLKYAYEKHFGYAYKKYPWLRRESPNKNSPSVGINYGGGYDIYERWARTSTQYVGEFPSNTVTFNEWWLRPEAFEVINDEKQRNALKRRFPDGCKIIYCNDEYCESENCALDDDWTIAINPLTDYIHYEPMGLLLTSVQEIVQDLISLVLQTIEHGIPQTFADPEVLNFPAYSKQEVAPGTIYPAKPKTGKSMADAFYEVKTATLSQEVQPFSEKILELGQLVSGALPSLFGGAQPNSSKTAAQYSMSRAQALQRLQSPYKVLTFWWKNTFGKVIPAYIKEMKTDEKWSSKNATGNFINTVVKRAEMQGKLGDIELEASDQLPITLSQQKDVLMSLMQGGDPNVLGAIFDPENLSEFANVLGLTNFTVPGEDDRIKQYEEIQQLIASAPIPNPGFNPMMGNAQQLPSVDIEPLVDNHKIEADICRRWLVSEVGRQTKVNNNAGYKNVMLHMQRHMDAQALMQQTLGGGQPQPNGNAGNKAQPVIPQNKQSQATVQ